MKDWKMVQVITSQINSAAQKIASALSGSQAPSSQNVTEALYSLKETLFPELGIEKDNKAARVKEVMKKVPDSIKITPVGEGQRGR